MNYELIKICKKAADAWRETTNHWQAAEVIDMLILELEKLDREKQPVIIRCKDCSHAEDICKSPADYLAPYWCHELDKQMSAIDYCSRGEAKHEL